MIIKIEDNEEFYCRVVSVLKNGGVVALPTDTVYGLAVNALDENALSKLKELKKRDKDKPLTYFMPRSRMQEYAILVKSHIIEYHVPGPLTAVLRKRPETRLADFDGKIGIRIPQLNTIIKLLNKHHDPLAVTSANISGERTVTTAREINETFPALDLIIDNGELRSEPSTVIDLTLTPPMLLRKGLVPMLEIERIYGRPIRLKAGLKFNVLFVCSGNTCRSPMAAGILKTMVEPGICDIRSAGTLPVAGTPAAEHARTVVAKMGGSLEKHQSQTISRELLDWADLILVMEYKHYDQILTIDPAMAVKTFLLREYKRKVKYNEVPDPVGQGYDRYGETADIMLASLKLIAREIERRYSEDKS